MKTQSSELQRKAEELVNNHNRKVAWLKKSAMYRYVDSMSRYKDKKLGKEYESWLDNAEAEIACITAIWEKDND